MRGFSRDPGELLDRDTMSGRDHAHAWPTLLAEMALLVQDEQVDADRVQLGQERHEVLQAAAEPVDAPSHDHIELTARRCLAQRIELRALVLALRAADAVIAIDLRLRGARAIAKFW
jgi:hypothetical protein